MLLALLGLLRSVLEDYYVYSLAVGSLNWEDFMAEV